MNGLAKILENSVSGCYKTNVIMNKYLSKLINSNGGYLPLFLLFLGLGLSSCLPEDGPVVNIGEERNGGVVAYVFQSNDDGYKRGETHGIIVAKEDLPMLSQWGCRGTEVGGTSTGVGAGKNNTEIVLAFHDNLPNYYTNPTQCHPLNDGTVAGNLARQLNVNGETGWFVPSRQEAVILYQNREQIGGFVEEDYWSSCESGRDRACVVSFTTGQTLSADKNEVKRVRPIKYF
jgi:hypothetical protein